MLGRRSRTVRTVLVAGLLLAGCSGGEATRAASGAVTAAGAWSVFDLRPGDCVGDVSDLRGDVGELPLVPCDEPHSQEVYALVRHPDDAYPGAEPVATFADRACLTALDAELGLSIDGITFTYLLPTSEGWGRDGDRTIVCVLVFPADPGMTGSFVAGTADLALLDALLDARSG